MAESDITFEISCGNVFADLGLPDANVLMTVSQARAAVGDGARPTGRLRLLQAGPVGRLQHEWGGPLGTFWLDVPVERVAGLTRSEADCGCAPGVCTRNRACPRLTARVTEH